MDSTTWLLLARAPSLCATLLGRFQNTRDADICYFVRLLVFKDLTLPIYKRQLKSIQSSAFTVSNSHYLVCQTRPSD